MCFQMAGKSKKVVREDPPPDSEDSEEQDPSWNPLGEEEEDWEDSEDSEEEEELR